jgi:glycosyltransferase involved in cell wall biosynthesis
MGDEGITFSKIKVVRMIARLNIGGPAIHAILLSRHLETLGYHTVLVAGQVDHAEGDMNYLAEAEGVEPVIISRLGRKLLPLSDLVAFLRILRLLFSWRPQIVHTHTAKAGAVGRMAAAVYNTAQDARHGAQSLVRRRFCPQETQGQKGAINNEKCKVVHTFHGHVLQGYFSKFKSRFFQLIEKILARFTDVIVVVSEQQKDELCKKFGIGRPEQYRVVPLGLNLNSLEKASETKGVLKSSLGFSDNEESLVGIVGRLTPIKNHSLFLESVSVLMKEDKDIRTRFLIVGDGDLRRDLEMMTKEFALADRVIFTGWLKDLRSLYADMNVLALTSNNEGTPVAVIEAMAAGVPVIATDVGGVRELISERGTQNVELEEGEFEICERGVLVRKGDVQGFVKGLKYLLEHPEKSREMGRRGQKYASQNHSVERLVADMDRLYKSLLSAGDK